jgi:5-methylcytosine-specific restriction protein A
MGVSLNDIRKYIINKINNMESDYIVLVSGDIHRELGGYPGKNHNMPSCCSAMRSQMINSDKILFT